MKHLLIIITLFLGFSCSEEVSNKSLPENVAEVIQSEFIIGERIDGPANIRENVNGKLLFSLTDNILVETTHPEDNWLKIGLQVDLTEMQSNSAEILPGSLLFMNGKEIGKAFDTIDVWINDSSRGYIAGFTHAQNIKENSYPENYLSYLINQGNPSKSVFQDFMVQYEFEKYELGNLPDLTEFFIYESLIVDESPRDRILLLFNKDKLIGFVHSRPVRTKFKTFELIRDHKLTLIADLPDPEIKKIRDKKIEFYNSID